MKTPKINPIARGTRLKASDLILMLALGFCAAQEGFAATIHWIAVPGTSANTNWSTAANWSGVQQTYFNQVQFLGTGAIGAAGVINNCLDSTTAASQVPIWELDWTPTNANYTTLIAPGVNLQTGAGNGKMFVGADSIAGNNAAPANAVETITITGAQGTFTMNPASGSYLMVDQGSVSAGDTHNVTLDMSGLGNFVMNNASGSRFLVANAHRSRSHGVAYLAMTNVINLGNDFQIGYIGNWSNSVPIACYLGQTNTILVGSGSPQVVVGYQGCMSGGFLKFNPAFLASSPGAYFGSTQAGGRMNNFWVGINASGLAPSSGTVDFSGGNVTLMTANLELGRSGSAANGASASGTLTFDTGVVDANVVLVGNQTVMSAGAAATGVINVGANATLKANTSLTLGFVATNGTPNAGSSGTLNVNGGTLIANFITNGVATGSMNFTNANWNLNLTPGITAYGNATVTNFNTGGTTNLISVSWATLPSTYPFTNRLVVYQTLGGLGLANLGVSLPAGGSYVGSLVNNTAAKAIDLVVTAGASPSSLAWTGNDPSGNWDVATTVNWTNGAGSPTTYHQLDSVRFDDTASGVTSVNLATTLTPSGLTINNSAKNYTFSGSGNLAGAGATGGNIPGGLVKEGTGALVLANTTADTYGGGVTISGGILQVGDGSTLGSGSLGPASGTVANAGGLVINRPSGDTLAVGNLISGAGGITNKGGGTLQLNSANTFTGPMAINAGTLQLGNSSAMGATSGGALIASGATLDMNGFNPGAKPITVAGVGSGSGAILNNNNSGTPQLTAVTLSGDATFGGSQRWDLQVLFNANGHNVTYANSTYCEWRDLNAATVGNVDVTSGTLGWVGSTAAGTTGTLTVENAATLKFYNDGGTAANLAKPLVLNDGSTVANGGGASLISASISLSGFDTFDVGGTSLMLSGPLSGSGTIYKQAVASSSDTSPLLITGNSPGFAGAVSLYAGKVRLDGNLGSGAVTTQSGTLLAGIGGVTTGSADIAGGYTPGDAATAGTNAFGSLTLEASALMTNNLATSVNGPGNSLVVVNGSLTINSTPTIYINPLNGTLDNSHGPYTLITYSGTLTLTGPLPTAQTVSGSSYTLTVTNPPGKIQLLVTGGTPQLLVWDDASGNATWDAGISGNWSNTVTHVANDVFNQPDSVLFDDSISNSAFPATAVTISGSVSPSAMTNNSSASYSLSGGAIAGGSIYKSGSGTLTLSNANSFNGPVVISGGTVLGAASGAFGSGVGAIVATNGATVDVGFGLGSQPIMASGTGVGGLGAIVNNNGGAIYGGGGYAGLANTVTLLGDTTFGGANRWDLGNQTSAALTTANHNYNLTLTGPPGSYREWAATLSIDTNLGNIGIQGGLEQGLKCSALGNPTNTVTVFTNSTLTFWAGTNYTKNYLVKNGGTMNVRLDGPNFNLTTTMEGGATFHSINNQKTMTAPFTLLGVANFTCDNNTCAFSNVISGAGGFNFSSGSANFIFAAANTYTGPTTIGSGLTLSLVGNGSIPDSSLITFGGTSTNNVSIDVSGKSGQTLTLSSGQILAGSGLINGALTVNSGATCAPGTTNPTTGGIIAQGAISMGATATNAMKVASGANDVIQSGTSIAFGGTLNVLFVPGSLTAGNSWKLYSAPAYSSSFSSLTPSSPGSGLVWDTSQLYNAGVLKVASATPPQFSSARASGGNFILTGSGGSPGAGYSVLSTNSITIPLATWPVVSSGTYDNSGNFSNSIPIVPADKARFYRLRAP